jgi:hypothetical protein
MRWGLIDGLVDGSLPCLADLIDNTQLMPNTSILVLSMVSSHCNPFSDASSCDTKQGRFDVCICRLVQTVLLRRDLE